jgi:hypothetical protein
MNKITTAIPVVLYSKKEILKKDLWQTIVKIAR